MATRAAAEEIEARALRFALSSRSPLFDDGGTSSARLFHPENELSPLSAACVWATTSSKKCKCARAIFSIGTRSPFIQLYSARTSTRKLISSHSTQQRCLMLMLMQALHCFVHQMKKSRKRVLIFTLEKRIFTSRQGSSDENTQISSTHVSKQNSCVFGHRTGHELRLHNNPRARSSDRI